MQFINIPWDNICFNWWKTGEEIKANCSKQAGDGDKKIILWAGPAAKNSLHHCPSKSELFPFFVFIHPCRRQDFQSKLIRITTLEDFKKAALQCNLFLCFAVPQKPNLPQSIYSNTNLRNPLTTQEACLSSVNWCLMLLQLHTDWIYDFALNTFLLIWQFFSDCVHTH